MARKKDEIIARMNEVGIARRVCVGNCPIGMRAESINTVDEENKKITFTIVSKMNAGTRYDWWKDEEYIEELSIAGATWDRLTTFFTDHSLRVDNAVGRIENVRIENGEIKCDVTFGSDSRAIEIFTKYKDRILTDNSIGYIVEDMVTTEKKDEPTHILVTRFEIVEVSAVWRGFDPGATAMRSANKIGTNANQERLLRLQQLAKEL